MRKRSKILAEKIRSRLVVSHHGFGFITNIKANIRSSHNIKRHPAHYCRDCTIRKTIHF